VIAIIRGCTRTAWRAGQDVADFYAETAIGGAVEVHVTKLVVGLLCAAMAAVAAFGAVRPRRATQRRIGWLSLSVIAAVVALLFTWAAVLGVMRAFGYTGVPGYNPQNTWLARRWLTVALTAGLCAYLTGRRGLGHID
jgi:hypothetical protein